MKKYCIRLLELLIAMNLSIAECHACLCEWQGPFSASGARSGKIVMANIVEYSEERKPYPKLSMIVEIVETFGALPDLNMKKRIRVYGDDGEQCRPYVEQFPIGSTWVLSLNQAGGGFAGRNESSTDFALSGCGTDWLEVVGEVVKGNIDDRSRRDSIQEMPLPTFRDKLRKWGSQQTAPPD